jgi:hypothetical protein
MERLGHVTFGFLFVFLIAVLFFLLLLKLVKFFCFCFWMRPTSRSQVVAGCCSSSSGRYTTNHHGFNGQRVECCWGKEGSLQRRAWGESLT